MRTILIVTIIAFAQMAFAGDRAGNGGDVVVCDANGVNAHRQPQLLDYYEYEAAGKSKLDLGEGGLSPKDKIELVLLRLERLDPARASIYRESAIEFWDTAKFMAGIEPEPIDDSHHIIKPADCEVAQAAVQLDTGSFWGSRYIVSKDLWDLLDNNNKAGLVIHEIIYKEALEFGHKDSVFVRKFNAWLADENFEKASLEEYHKFIENHFPIFNGRYPFLDTDLTTRSYYDDGKLEWVKTKPGNKSFFNFQGQKVFVEGDSHLNFYRSGVLKQFKPRDPLKLKLGNQILDFSNKKHIGLNEDGSIKFGDILNDNVLFEMQGKLRSINKRWDYEFHPDGSLSSGRFLFPQEFIKDGVKFWARQLWEHPNKTIAHARLSENFKMPFKGRTLELGGWVGFWPNGELNNTWIASPVKLPLLNSEVMAQNTFGVHSNGEIRFIMLTGGHEFEYLGKPMKMFMLRLHDNGAIEKTYNSYKATWRAGDGRQYEQRESGFIHLYKDGGLRCLDTVKNYDFQIQGRTFSLSGSICLFPNGKPRQVVMSESTWLYGVNGKSVHAIKDHFVTLDENELVVKVSPEGDDDWW